MISSSIHVLLRTKKSSKRVVCNMRFQLCIAKESFLERICWNSRRNAISRLLLVRKMRQVTFSLSRYCEHCHGAIHWTDRIVPKEEDYISTIEELNAQDIDPFFNTRRQGAK